MIKDILVIILLIPFVLFCAWLGNNLSMNPETVQLGVKILMAGFLSLIVIAPLLAHRHNKQLQGYRHPSRRC